MTGSCSLTGGSLYERLSGTKKLASRQILIVHSVLSPFFVAFIHFY